MEHTTATTSPATPTTSARLAPAAALALFIVYSVLVTVTSGSLSATCSPLLVAAIGLLVWHDRVTRD